MKRNNSHLSDEDLASLWGQTEDTCLTDFMKHILAKGSAAWVDSSVASAIKTTIVRLALSEKISPETAQSLIKWMRLKHA